MTNILAIAKIDISFLTRSNADWLDGWVFEGAGSATATPDDENTGVATFGTITVDPATQIGLYRLTVTDIAGSVKRFAVTTEDDEDIVLARGVVGAPVQVAGLEFVMTQGSPGLVVGDAFTITVLGARLNLSGIRFDAALRKARVGNEPYSANVDLSVSTAGASPMLLVSQAEGVVSLRVLQERMARLPAGIYDYDLIARAEGYTAEAASGTVEHVPGVTPLLD